MNDVLPWLLSPLAWAYGAATRIRNARFDRSTVASVRASIPIISIGNITAGGTGKTPHVILLVRRLLKAKRNPAILTRGYRGTRENPADEVCEFREAIPGVNVVVDANRVRGAAVAHADFSADCAIMDDGFQHRRLRRALDIVLIDALNPWGGGRLLPAGRLRESPRGLARAGLIILTRSDAVDAARRVHVEREIDAFAPEVPRLSSRVIADRVVGADNVERPQSELKGMTVLAACGIGNPRGFDASLSALGADVARTCLFPDHHSYADRDLRSIIAAARDVRAVAVVTTRKDWVKLARLSAARSTEIPIVRLETRVELDDAAGLLDRLLRQALEQEKSQPRASP